jgi:hypothetical protein
LYSFAKHDFQVQLFSRKLISKYFVLSSS